jgi:hypothetical protein
MPLFQSFFLSIPYWESSQKCVEVIRREVTKAVLVTRRLFHLMQPQDSFVVSYVARGQHCIVKQIMHFYVKNVTDGCMELIS